jgi:hypothetical protein
MWRRDPTACIAATVTIAGIAVNLAVLLITPLVRPDIDILADSLSFYAVGPWALVQTGAFAAMAIASLSLAFSVSREATPAVWRTLCAALLAIAGISTFGLIWFPMGGPMPSTFIGDMHQTAGTIAGVAQLAAALAFVFIARREPSWRQYLPLATIAFLLSLTGAILSQLSIWWPHLGIPMGATMRLAVVPLLILWFVIAWHAARQCRSS